MSRVPKIRSLLQQRANFLQEVRNFFVERDVIEVETPILGSTTSSNPAITPFITTCGKYLQTSPEFPMKRLLALGGGDIYQICKAFRADEEGERHNPEFLMLEWYRLNMTYLDLADEVASLIQEFLPGYQVSKYTYHELFLKFLDCDIRQYHNVSALLSHFKLELSAAAQQDLSFDDALELIRSLYIEPNLIGNKIYIVYEFPESQAELSVVANNVALRFEVILNGYELANGYQELLEASIYKARAKQNNLIRHQRGLQQIPFDDRLGEDLKDGLPSCSGVALGLERLMMCVFDNNNIADVLTFNWSNS